jgi:hypothetical protein
MRGASDRGEVRSAGAAAAAFVVMLSGDVLANCAMPSGYGVTVTGSSVMICPQNLEQRGCPDADGMLRASEGAVVQIADRCAADAGTDGCYVDDCVPKGQYEYGFAQPYACCRYCCGTYFYGRATVVDDLPPRCLVVDAGSEPALDDAGNGTDAGPPATDSVSAPWSTSNLICEYSGGGSTGTAGRGGSGGRSGSGGGAGVSGGGTGGQGGASAGGAAGSGAAASDGCSCMTVGAGGSASELVLGTNAVLVLLGLLLGRRRRST